MGSMATTTDGGMGKKAKRPAGSEAIMYLGLEILAVGIFTVLAGISHDMGTIVIIFMIGFWLIYMITDSAVIAKIGAALTTVAEGG
jgi:hypothetical protein